MDLVLNGKKIRTREEFHNEAEKLAFMDDGSYGRNLDALNDVLRSVKARVVFENIADLKKNLGSYADIVLEIFKNAEEDNEGLEMTLK